MRQDCREWGARHHATLTRKLGNGLTLLVRGIPEADVAAVVTRVGTGYFDEPDDVVGVSHVLEHMYFKGTSRRGPGDIGREIRAAGGIINAGTIYDHTSYYAVVPAEAVFRALDVHADALCDARIDPVELDRELKVIIEEVKRKRDAPAAVAQEALFAAMFDRHRMRRWRAGTEEALARFDEGTVRTYYQTQYRPDNVIVSVVGGVDPDAVMAEGERLFAGMPARTAPRDRGPAEPERVGFRFHEAAGAIHRAWIHYGWRTQPPLHPDTPALDLLAILLGQGRASRLYRHVRESGLVQEIGASHYTPTELGVLSIAAVGDPSDTRPALDAIAAVVTAASLAPLPAPELDRAKRIAEARMIRRLETVEGQANLLAEWQALGDWRLLDPWMERLLALTPSAVEDAAARYLDLEKATVSVYRPRSAGPLDWRPGATLRLPAAIPAAAAGAVPPVARARPTRSEDGVRIYEHGDSAVVVLPRATAPLVSLSFAYRAGAHEEAAERPGITTLMARTALKGTAARDAAGLAVEIEGLGGVIAGGAGADAFEWSLGLPARHFAAGLELLAEVARRPAFPGEELEIERKAMLGELAHVRDDMFAYPFGLMLEAAFEGHRYGAVLEAFERTVRDISVADLGAWHRRTVLGRPALALVVGDVDADAAAARVLACLDAGAGEAPPDPPPCAPRERRSRVVERDTAQTAIALGLPGPPRNHPDVEALRVLAAAVGGLGGRLFEELRSRRSLAYAVSASPLARLAGGLFTCYIATSPEREDEAREGLLREIMRVAAERLPEADVDRARRFMIGSRRIRLQTHAARLGELTGAFLLGRGIAELRDFEDRVRALGPEHLRSAAQAWFDVEQLAEGVVRGRVGAAPQ